MNLIRKAGENWEIGKTLTETGAYNHSVHHFYYSILQMMKHMVLTNGWITESKLRELKKGAHNAILNTYESNCAHFAHEKREFRKKFQAAKEKRNKADYEFAYVERDEQSSFLNKCEYLKRLLHEELNKGN